MNEEQRAEQGKRMKQYWAEVKAGKRPVPKRMKLRNADLLPEPIVLTREVSDQILRLQAKLTKAWGFEPNYTQTVLFALNEAMQ